MSFCRIFLYACVLATTVCAENAVKNSSLTGGAKGWSLWNCVFDPEVSRIADGSGSIRFHHVGDGISGHVYQQVVLDQKRPEPFLFSVWSKSEGLKDFGVDREEYGLRGSLLFQDGETSWTHIVSQGFSSGTHGWEYREYLCVPPKPVKALNLYGRFARHGGKVWFDDFSVIRFPAEKAPPAEGCSARTERGKIILENGYLKLTVDPKQGAGSDSLIDKQTGTVYGGNHPDYRLFTGRIGELPYPGVMRLPWSAVIERNVREECSARFSLVGVPGFPYLSLERKITIRNSSPAVIVENTYFNAAEAMAPLKITPYFRHGFSSGEPLIYSIPRIDRIFRRKDTLGGGEFFHRHPAAGWGCANSERGNGIAVEFDLARTGYVYHWMKTAGESTLEWAMNPVSIPAGGKHSTAYRIFPFHEVHSPDAVENGMIVEFKKEGLNVFSCQPRLVRAKFFRDSGGMDEKIGETIFRTGRGSATMLAIPRFDLSGARALKVEFSDLKGNTLLAAVSPFVSPYRFVPRCGREAVEEELPGAITLSRKLVTPHIPWANPHEKGPVRALVLTALEHGREIIELAQRLELDFTTVRISDSERQIKWGWFEHFGSFTFNDSNAALKKALEKDYDLVILSGKLVNRISPENRKAIRNKLSAKTGFVLISPGTLPPEFKEFATGKAAIQCFSFPSWERSRDVIPELSLPGEAFDVPFPPGFSTLASADGKGLVGVGKVGEIPVVQINYAARGALLPVIPYRVATLPDYHWPDYSFLPLIRALLHAAGRNHAVKIEHSDHLPLTFCVSGLPENGSYTMRLHVESVVSGSRTRREISSSAQNGAASFDFGNVPLTPGVNAMGFQLLRDGKVVDFGVCAISPEVSGLPAPPMVAGGPFSCGEQIRGKALHSGVGRLEVVLLDSLGREIDRSSVSGGDFLLNVRENSTRRMFVESRLFFNDVLQGRAKTPVIVKKDPRPAAYSVIATSDDGDLRVNRYLNRYRYQALRDELGVDTIRFWNTSRPQAYEDQLQYDFDWDFPIIPGQRLRNFASENQNPYEKTKEKKYLVRNPCYHDADFVKSIHAIIPERLKQTGKYSPVSYDFDDESSLTKWSVPFDFCFSPATLDAFREWLKKRYATVEQLNHSWGTDFSAWAEITPRTSGEIRRFAKENRNYSSWAEFREFMDVTYAGFHADVTREIRRLGCDRTLDISGTAAGTAYNGLEWPRFAEFINQASMYHQDDQEELMRSFGRIRVTPWNGYADSGDFVRYRIWLDAFSFKEGGASYYSIWSMLRPDFTLPPFDPFADSIRDLRRGIGSVLAACDDAVPDVLIHFSQANIRAATIEDRYPAYINNRKGHMELLDDLHAGYRFISDRDIENGVLNRSGTGTLLLPHAAALSEREVDAIRKFVAAGNTVIADRYAGIMDRNCRLLKRGQLDDLFGLSGSDHSDDGEINFANQLIPRGAARGNVQSGDVIVNRYGKGKAVFLNFSASRYSQLRRVAAESGNARIWRDRMGAFIRRGGCGIEITNFGMASPLVRSFRYRLRNGNTLLLGAVRAHGIAGDAKMRVKLDRPYAIYELRSGEFLGKRQDFEMTLQPAGAKLYAMHVNAVAAPEIRIAETFRAGENCSYEVAIPGSALNHPLRVELFAPDGKMRRLYSGLHSGVAGKFKGAFRFAFNDQSGLWKIRICDLLTGQFAEREFRLVRTGAPIH